MAAVLAILGAVIENCWPVFLTGQALFGGQLDWFLLVGSLAWRHRDSAIFIYELILPLLPALITGAVFVLFQPLRFIALLLDHTEAGPTDCGRPVLFKCKTTHRRVFPAKHGFGYSYLVAGIPVSWKGQVGGMLSAGMPRVPNMLAALAPSGVRQMTWFEVNPEDHLQRGGAEMNLREKLDVYLESEGVDGGRYPYVYLVTAPRILGYSFNPVSFWYLYDEEKSLGAVICEVNNTFDERRVYLVSREESSSRRELPDSNLGDKASSSSSSSQPSKIRNRVAKDFHVSPFNSRKGHYSIVASDPLGQDFQSFRSLDTTITLSSSKGHAKLVARLLSLGEPLNPAKMTVLEKIRLLLCWGWIGFVTYPRIVKEAAMLWFARKLHVWYRPEPLSTSLGRRADSVEKDLEGVFREYLRYLVEQSATALVVKYVPSGVGVPTETMTSPSAKGRSEKTAELEFKVLTPAFYARFVHYAHDFEAIFNEFRESCTVSISNPDLLPHLVLKKPPAPAQVGNPIDYLYLKTIQHLRRRPDRIDRPLRSSDKPKSEPTNQTIVDIRDFRPSSMDGYVFTKAPAEMRRQYRSTVARIFLAEHISLGSLGLLWFEGLILRVGLAWLVATGMDPFIAMVVSEVRQVVSTI